MLSKSQCFCAAKVGHSPVYSLRISMLRARHPHFYALLLGRGTVVLNTFRPTAFADPKRSLGVRMTNVLPLPSPTPSWPRLNIGRRVSEHACLHQAGLTGLHLRSVLQFAYGFFPTRPRGVAQLPLAHSCLQQAL